jgi:hypothetical protein
VAILGPGGSVRVIVYDQRHVDPSAEPCLERLGPPGQVWGEPDYGLIVIHPTRCTDTHRFNAVPPTQLLDCSEDRVFDSLRAL